MRPWTSAPRTPTASRGSRRARAAPRSPTRRPTPRRSCARRALLSEEGVAAAVFPELGLSGYAIDDLLLQDALLDGVEAAVRDGRRGHGRAAPAARRRRPAAPPQPDLQLRRRRAPRAGARRGAQGATCRPTASSTSAASSRRATTSAAARSGSAARRCRSAPTCCSRRSDVAGPRRPRRGLRGPVDPDPAQLGGRARGRDRAAQPLRQPDHGRPRRGPRAAVPRAVLALPRRLRLHRRGPGRVEHRPVVGRADDDPRERGAARRDGALPATATAAPSPTSTSTCCARSARGWARSTTTGARTPPAPARFRRIAFTLGPPDGDLGLRRRRGALPVRARRPRPGSSRTATRPTTSRSPGCSSGSTRSARRRSSSASRAAWTPPTR